MAAETSYSGDFEDELGLSASLRGVGGGGGGGDGSVSARGRRGASPLGKGATSSRGAASALDRPRSRSPKLMEASIRSGSRGGGARSPTLGDTMVSVVSRTPLDFTGPIKPHPFKEVVAAEEPGPGEYSLEASLGPQHSSTRPTLPAFGFSKTARMPDPVSHSGSDYVAHDEAGRHSPAYRIGTAPRDQYTKSYISKEMVQLNLNTTTAHAEFLAAEKTTSIGPMVESGRKTSPRFSFSKAARMAIPKAGFLTSRSDYVDPTVAAVATRTALSSKVNSPRFSFGTERRARDSKPVATSNATTLASNQASSLGKMVVSTKKSNPSWKMGTEPRMVEEYRYTITRAAGFAPTDNRELAAPSPVLRTAPAYGFGTTTRDRKVSILPAHLGRGVA